MNELAISNTKHCLNGPYFTPEQRNIKNLLVDLRNLKSELSTPEFVILISECADRVIVSVRLPGGKVETMALFREDLTRQYSRVPTTKVRSFDYDVYQLSMAKAFLLNAHAEWEAATNREVAA